MTIRERLFLGVASSQGGSDFRREEFDTLGYLFEGLPANIYLTDVASRACQFTQLHQLVDDLLDVAADEGASGRQHLVVDLPRHRTFEYRSQIGMRNCQRTRHAFPPRWS